MPSRTTTILTVLSVLTAGQAIAGKAIAGQTMGFDIEAHRGGRALLPENTLPAFANALSMGVDTLELDVGVTADGEIVVSHERGLNPDLARDAGGAYIAPPGTPFLKLRLDEIRAYDVGQIRPDSAYAKQFPDQRALPGTRIPTLSELFALVRKSGNTNVRFNIETKIDPNRPDETLDPQGFVSKLLGRIEAERFSDRVMVQSFDWQTLQLVQQQAPKIPTVYLTLQRGSAPTIALDKATSWTAGFSPADHGGSLPRTIKSAGGAIWSPYFGDVTATLVSEAHALGLRVVVWTVNKRDDMARMIEFGVDGIISDRPDLLREVAGEKGIALPAGTPVAP
ncbi:glycerophosphodiester phosphodiesterase [Bradyrhizobium sp. UNPF46]|uniref:glycerophosphodiester phosphodiesterase n=1 Tax=Bradyrhizobium sp. UNPF46 TaxID=1141168 RepID=UPI00115045FA|nr:glycerophosphodiester phosphodiesterase [Bradyrhizobium sp. UNPF46]TQF43380.1 glycerophosphodiester phosphodiesterase [Bradyrhizobium sp. UNPF46]